MHTDLPPTTIRGYGQANNGTRERSELRRSSRSVVSGTGDYCAKDRPVRVLFKNLLPAGRGGNLFIPVDTTYMGAGHPTPQNRGTLHLHGGATPWISDGTPHQWTTPAGEADQHRGDSTAFVPDMWFDRSGNFVPAVPAQPRVPLRCHQRPRAGTMTFYWTNQQGGRLMFYHDHAYGITRLNVYAGEAAGYLFTTRRKKAALA